jgi:hypothetical protein
LTLSSPERDSGCDNVKIGADVAATGYPAKVRGHRTRVNYSDDERRMRELLTRYAAGRRAQAGGKVDAAAADFVTMLLKKRLFSSPKAFAETIGIRPATLQLSKIGVSSVAEVGEQISPL